MRMQIFSIFDTASGAYMRPFFMFTEVQAKRSFADLVDDAGHEVGKHPEDYSLVSIGGFDDQSGEISGEDVKVLMTGLAARAASRRIDSESLALFESEELNKA